MRALTGGSEIVDASGANVREVLENIENQFPGIMDRLCQDGSIRPDVSVVVGGGTPAPFPRAKNLDTHTPPGAPAGLKCSRTVYV